MNISREISELARGNLHVWGEIEALDTELRVVLDDQQRRRKAPWTMMGRKELASEELKVWQKLDLGEISGPEAITQMKKLMTIYYR